MSTDNSDNCGISLIHEDTVNDVRGKMPPEKPIFDVSELFRIIGDITRSKIICALRFSELCVCDIAALLNMTSSAISHQLHTLKQAGIVACRRNGKVVYYRLADEHIEKLFNIAFEHIMED